MDEQQARLILQAYQPGADRDKYHRKPAGQRCQG